MKAFASDFDGTIYFMKEEPHMRAEDVEAIHRFQASGNLYGVCTGRSLNGILGARDRAVDFDFYILANGSVILDREQKEIYKRCMEYDTLKALHERVKDLGELVIHANDTVYTFGGGRPLQTHIDSLEELKDADIYGLSVFMGMKDKELAGTVNEEFKGILTAYPNKGITDIVSFGCSKGNAVRRIKEILGADLIAGIGDSYNDVPMFETADVSFTFTSSQEDVRDKADHVVDKAAQAIAIFEEM